MMKLALLAFLLVALSAAAATTKESCRRESSQHSIDQCRSFMKHGQSQLLMSTGDGGDVEDDDNEESAPQECCMQLRQVRRDCRCAMIRDMMQEMEEEEGVRGPKCRGRCEEMMMRGRYLPAMCNVEPHTCRMSQGGGY